MPHRKSVHAKIENGRLYLDSPRVDHLFKDDKPIPGAEKWWQEHLAQGKTVNELMPEWKRLRRQHGRID